MVGRILKPQIFIKTGWKLVCYAKTIIKKWIVDFVDSSSRGDLHNKLTQFSITGQLLWKMSRPPVSEQNLGPLANSCQFFLTVSSRGGWLAQQTSPSPRSLEFIMKKESSPCSLRPRGLLRAFLDFTYFSNFCGWSHYFLIIFF